MSEQLDSFSNEYVPDREVLMADTLDFAAIVDDVQSDGVGHTKADVARCIVKETIDLMEGGYYPAWVKGGVRAVVDKGLDGAYNRRDEQGLLLCPAVNAKHERKTENFMDRQDYQYVMQSLLDSIDQQTDRYRMWKDRYDMRFEN